MNLCPPCCWSKYPNKEDKRKRQEMAFSFDFHNHYVCDGCGNFMYMSYSGIKYSRSMEFIMYHVEREQENDLFRVNVSAQEKRKYLATVAK